MVPVGPLDVTPLASPCTCLQLNQGLAEELRKVQPALWQLNLPTDLTPLTSPCTCLQFRQVLAEVDVFSPSLSAAVMRSPPH